MNTSNDLSEEMYRRAYRLIKRGLDLQVIAATLQIPVKSVQNIIDRLQILQTTDIAEIQELANKENLENKFLDIYFYTKTRYSMLLMVGMVVTQTKEILEKEIEKVYNTSWKAVAIRMADVTAIDESGIKIIASFFERMHAHERFAAILDPSPEIEPHLAPFEGSGKIAVFGTERAFEEKAFEPKKNTSLRRK